MLLLLCLLLRGFSLDRGLDYLDPLLRNYSFKPNTSRAGKADVLFWLPIYLRSA
jgi:hypothetical protein